ncbi:hypothetical protein ACKAV7_005693 [Fusarium commune]|nr:hypothetical protein LZL87_005894 [Fusarium oxysporum]
MKLAHVLPILTLVVPIACGKYDMQPWELKEPTDEEKKAREAWLDTQRDITAACEDLILETTRPKAQYEEQLNVGVLSVQKVTEEASNRLVAFEGPMVYDYNFSKRCVNDTRIKAPPLPRVDDMRWYLVNTANAYADIDEYCKSKGFNSSDIGE